MIATIMIYISADLLEMIPIDFKGAEIAKQRSAETPASNRDDMQLKKLIIHIHILQYKFDKDVRSIPVIFL